VRTRRERAKDLLDARHQSRDILRVIHPSKMNPEALALECFTHPEFVCFHRAKLADQQGRRDVAANLTNQAERGRSVGTIDEELGLDFVPVARNGVDAGVGQTLRPRSKDPASNMCTSSLCCSDKRYSVIVREASSSSHIALGPFAPVGFRWRALRSLVSFAAELPRPLSPPIPSITRIWPTAVSLLKRDNSPVAALEIQCDI
jgi:hypothetical protein